MIGTKLKAILAERDINVNELSRRIGVSAQTLYSTIKRNTNKIDFNVLLKICTELDVPVELFYGSIRPPELPEIDELNLLKKYRQLDNHGREITNIVLNCELSRVMSQNPNDERVVRKIIPLYSNLSSVGHVNPTYGKDYEDYEVQPDSLADYAVRLNGYSMEPYIKDGSIVLVSRSIPLSDGDVGLFLIDEDIKCKQYCVDSFGNICLLSVSRNNKSTDAAVISTNGTSVFCFGKLLLPRRSPVPAN